jgi:hypothetical protein
VRVVEHALLGLSVAALVGAGLRLGWLCAGRGLDRALGAASFAAAFAVLEAMLLATVDLGSDPLPLSAAAVATWLLVARLVQAPAVPVTEELKSWLRGASKQALVAVAAGVGLALTWTAWSLNSPYVGIDGISYHLPQIVRWIHSGSPGAVDHIHYWLWVGDYPLVNGVLQAWGMGISRSMVVISVWPVASMAILITAGWAGLRSVGVGIPLRVLAIVAVVTVPVVMIGLVGPLNDLPGLAWLACGAALFAGARENPRLAVPGVVALGLAAGTKTTGLPLALATLVGGLLLVRSNLRVIARPLALAGALALVVGGFWYLRDLINHGSPFWPWATAPWGDPKPRALEHYGSLLAHPGDTLDGRLDEYATFIAGAAILLPAGVILSFASGRRWTRVAGVGVLALIILWASAPSTGKTTGPVFDGSVSQTRYLLPTMALAAVVIALVGREGGRRRLVACGVLGGAILWNLGQLLTAFFPVSPSNTNLALGLAFGIALGLVLARLRDRLPIPKRGWAVASTVLASALMAIPAAGWLNRHGDVRAGGNFNAGLARFLSMREDFQDGEHPIYMSPVLAGTLSGDHLQHDVVLIPASMPCHRVARLQGRGWVIIRELRVLPRDPDIGYTVGRCLSTRRPLAVIDGFRVYSPRAMRSPEQLARPYQRRVERNAVPRRDY